MSDRFWLRLGAAAGLAYVVLVLVGFGLGVASGRFDDDVAKAVTSPPGPLLWVSAYIELLGFLCFLVFVARLWATLRRAEGDPAWLSAIALGAGYLFVALTLVAFAAGGAATYRYGHGIEVQVAQTLQDLGQAAFILTWAANAVSLGATAIVALRRHALPRWLGWSAVVLAAALLAAIAVPNSSFPMIPGFLALFWVVATSIILMRRADEPQPALSSAPVSSTRAAA